MNEKLFEAALGTSEPWHVLAVDLDAAAKTLTIRIDFTPGSRFAVPAEAGVHPVHDTVSKRYRHLNFFQHECYLQVRVPRVKLPSGAVRQVEPDWAGKLSGFTLSSDTRSCALRRHPVLRTPKEQLLWVRTFETVEELRRALLEFKERFNRHWLLQRHGYATPAQVRPAYTPVVQAA